MKFSATYTAKKFGKVSSTRIDNLLFVRAHIKTALYICGSTNYIVRFVYSCMAVGGAVRHYCYQLIAIVCKFVVLLGII